MKIKLMIIAVASLGMLTGCNWNHASNSKPEYRTVASDPTRNTQLAREYNSSAVALLKDENYDEAEHDLKEALSCDVFFGPAHNNLGHVYYKQKKYYLAAWEFQYAAKLMPNSPEPKNNLAIVLEAAGKPDQATKYYEEALKIQPDNPEFIGNLARVYIKQNQTTLKTYELLQEIILKDTRTDWTHWASSQLASKNFTEKK